MASAAEGPLGARSGVGTELSDAGTGASAATPSLESKRISPIPPEDVAEFVGALEKAVRARRLYQDNNPVYQGFLKGLHESVQHVFRHGSGLSMQVEENGFRWYGQLLQTGAGRDNLAFLFFKDGVRQLSFLEGFEDEAERFLSVVHRARTTDQQSDDDMVTLLWEEEFTCFQYSYVDALAEGLQLPDGDQPPITDSGSEASEIDPASVQQELATGGPPEEQSPAVRSGMPSVASSITREDFAETLYFLEGEELQALQAEVQKEWERDTKRDVLNALFDRLEDPVPEWQDEILRILRQLLPAFLSRGDLRSASYIVVELNKIAQTAQLVESAQREADRLFAELSEPAVLSQLLRSLEEGAIQPDPAELGVFLAHLGPRALPILLNAVETMRTPGLQARLQQSVEALARDHQGEVVRLLGANETAVACGAARVAGRMAIGAAVPGVVELLGRADPAVRRTAVDALINIRSGTALDALQNAVEDEDREVRLAAVRGLAALRYQPARARLEKALEGRIVREADLTEKMAFFEAFGTVATADNIDMLDRMLNGKKLFSRPSPELRACAALALGKINAPAARTALERAADDAQPIVRNAVLKALRRDRGDPA